MISAGEDVSFLPCSDVRYSNATMTNVSTKMSVLAAFLVFQCQSFMPIVVLPTRTTRVLTTMTSYAHINAATANERNYKYSRRSFVTDNSIAVTVFGIAAVVRPSTVIATDGNLRDLLGQIKEGREQLESVPELIKAEKWDAIRAVLAKPPLSTMWTSKGQKGLLNDYAAAIANELPNGDEIAALELREDIVSHLRYLDMAVYNNVFNPIATEGATGASKELVRSFYEDPINEWKASKSAIDDVIALSSPL
jgi:hypothetical protein